MHIGHLEGMLRIVRRKKTDAFFKGMEAQWCGMGLADNPYDDSLYGDAWDAGFKASGAYAEPERPYVAPFVGQIMPFENRRETS